MSSNYKTKNQKTKAPVTIETVEKKCKLEYVVVNLICLFVFIAFGYIAIMAFIQTSVIEQKATDPKVFSYEHVLFETDIIPLNIVITGLFVMVLFWLRRFYDFFAKVNITIMEVALALLTVTLGLIWIFSVRSVPAADSKNIFDAATGAAKDDYTSMIDHVKTDKSNYYGGYSYFQYYPFQLGFVFICEIIYRIFGTESSMPVQVINVLCVGATYFALARMTKLLFKRKSIEFIAILLLAVCFQPILFCTFVYGNIIGMCCAVWASLLLIKYFQTEQYRWAAVSGALLVLATLAKYNNMIYLAAFVIVLLIHIVKKKKWQSAVIAAALIAAVLGSNALVTGMYKQRSGTDFESGVSQVMYLNVGLNESGMAPGWYTPVGKDTYYKEFLVKKYEQNKDVTVSDANEKSWENINKRLETFSNDSDYTLDFFSKKILSQWNEPAFESIWVSQVKSHTASEGDKERLKAANETISSQQMEGLAKSVYYKSTGQYLYLHFNLYMQIVYIMFAAGIFLLFVHGKTNISTVLLPLVLLGAFSYHLLFEGKSQYILTYIPLLVPTAAYAFNAMLCGKYEKLKKIISAINFIPKKYNESET